MKLLRRLRDTDWPVAVAFSVMAHVLVLGAVLISWSIDPEINRVTEVPPHVQARVIEKPEPAPRPVPKPAPKPQPEPKPKPKPKPAPEPEPKPKAKPEPVPAEEDTVSDETEVTPDFSQPDLSELLAREELEMSRQGKPAGEEDQQEAPREGEALEEQSELANHIAAIRSAVARRWTRPPSARNEMRTVLRIRLLPGGEVVDVAVVESSGNQALDRSTVAAVKNSSPLPVPAGDVFNEHFRVFTMSFKPEDLRL